MRDAARSALLVRVALLACMAVGVAAGVALAQSGVLVRVHTVLATDSGSEFDSRLEPQRRQLVGLFRYSSFRLVSDESRQCTFDSPQSFEIPGGRYLQVKPLGTRNDRLRLKVMLLEGASRPPLDTLFSVPDHGNIWLAGPRHPEGILLISIGAQNVGP
jgi:hypothetical protein